MRELEVQSGRFLRVDKFHMGQRVAQSQLAWAHYARRHSNLEALFGAAAQLWRITLKSKANNLKTLRKSLEPSRIALKRQTHLVRIRILAKGIIFALEGGVKQTVCGGSCVGG